MLSLCCTKVIRNRLRLPAQLPAPVQPPTRLGDWYVRLRGSDISKSCSQLASVLCLRALSPARRLRQCGEVNFQGAVAELLSGIEYVALFRGTIDGASVCPREVVKLALEKHASAVLLAHFVARHKMELMFSARSGDLVISMWGTEQTADSRRH